MPLEINTMALIFLTVLRVLPSAYFQLGAISVLFRQTNIIWVGFTAGTVVIRSVVKPSLFSLFFVSVINDRKNLSSRPKLLIYLTIRDIENRGLLQQGDDFVRQTEIAVRVILRYLWQYLLLLLPYLMVLAGFGVFIILNGGIVVGKRSFILLHI